MNQSNRFALPFLEAGQAQKEVTHNGAIRAIDDLLHLSVLGRTESAPPSLPVTGGLWIVATAGTGAWTGHDHQLAAWDGFGWSFRTPAEGMLAWVAGEAVFTVFRGGAWSAGGWPASALDIAGRTVLGASPTTIAPPAGGAMIDAEARAVIVALSTALRSQGIIA